MTDSHATIANEYDHRSYDDGIDREIAFRPAAMERALGRLHRWLNSEHVLPYWELDEALPAFERALFKKLDDDHLTPYIGCLDHVPMSYWEVYWAAEDSLANHYDARPTDRGLHLLIGPPEYLGAGYAASLLREMTALQFAHPDTVRVVAGPDAGNDRAIAVFEECGFEPRFEFDEEEKAALLVVCEREHFEREVAR